MLYCETSDRAMIQDSKNLQQNNGVARHRARTAMFLLKALITPETTIPGATRESEGVWFGVVKTLFWTANAIIMGVVLAKLCS